MEWLILLTTCSCVCEVNMLTYYFKIKDETKVTPGLELSQTREAIKPTCARGHHSTVSQR